VGEDDVSNGGDDELEHSLLQIRTLIESTVALHRNRNLQQSLITNLDNDYNIVLDEAQRLILSASRSIDIVHARRLGSDERSERSERDLIYGAREQVRVRLLTSPALLDEEYVREQLGRERPVSVRIARVPPLQAMIVDGSTALVVADSAVGRRASLIRVPEVLNTLQTLFENVWVRAVSAGERTMFGDRYRASLARQILGALQGGVTDEVAARDLAISVRTYRRHVAEIMSLLGANSRFQAGVRAAELGLLPPAAGPGTERGGPVAFS
jgi:ATP/maltotriose-dependent transcriptional regulator MalT